MVNIHNSILRFLPHLWRYEPQTYSNVAMVKRRIPIEAEAEDTDNMKIHILLHVVHGFMDEIEMYREDLQSIIEIPKPNALVLINLDDDQG